MTALNVRLNRPFKSQVSLEGVKINKITSSISPEAFIKFIREASISVNVRSPKDNYVVSDIIETLEKTPELFWYKSKGILISTTSLTELDRGDRVRISLSDTENEGIMDGGHNAYAIAKFIASTLFNNKKPFKDWNGMKQFWDEHYDEIEEKYKAWDDNSFNFSIPIEIQYPNDEAGALEQFKDLRSSICGARNTNAQVKDEDLDNQMGLYDYLKIILVDHQINWKTGEEVKGDISRRDLIALADLPLLFLQNHGLISDREGSDTSIPHFNRISIYSQKAACSDFYSAVVGAYSDKNADTGKYELKDPLVQSALDMTVDLMKFYDKIYLEFPSIYNNNSGSFGSIKKGVKMKESRPKFKTTTAVCNYDYADGYIIPLLTGVVNLMKYNATTNRLEWIINPNYIDLSELDLSMYVNSIKESSYNPQEVGKKSSLYSAVDMIFGFYLFKKHLA